MPRGFRLTRLEAQTPDLPGGATHRLRITVTDVQGMSAKIFLHHQVAMGEDAEPVSDFLAVCSPLDLVTYPEDAPEESMYPRYFRLAAVDILLPTAQLVTEAWNLIKAQADRLVSTMTQLDTLEEEEVYEVGEPD